MPEHFLNRAQVGAMNQHVGDEAVPEDVGGDRRCDAGLERAVFHDHLRTSGSQPLAIAEVEKDRLEGAGTRRQLMPSIECVDRGLADRNQTGLVTLAVADYQHSGLAIDVVPVQRHGLRDAQA
jgi:hypothetical protein